MLPLRFSVSQIVELLILSQELRLIPMVAITCKLCNHEGFDCREGFYNCQMCGYQEQGMIETGISKEEFMGGGDAAPAVYNLGNRRAGPTVIKTEPITFPTQPQTQEPQFWSIKKEPDDIKPSIPNDFGSTFNDPESFLSEIRIRYVMGIQLMIQFQCQALVETFDVSPLICGLSGVIWLRFVAVSRVFDERWADDAIEASEMQEGDAIVAKPRGKYCMEPHNMHGRRAATIWLRSLRKKIPLSTSLAVSFLACHIAREAILPTDIVKWALEGKLPYLNAFLNIEKTFGCPSITCPFSSSFMFRPFQVVGPMELEAYAGSIAQSLGLELPPVNFFTIARRYVKHLLLPVEKIIPYASRIYEWSMPPDLWLSANPKRLPSRLCVMSIIMVAIRVLHNINGSGNWEEMVSSVDGCSSHYQAKKSNSKCKVRRRIYGAKECSRSLDPKLNPDKSNCTTKGSPSGNLSEKSKSPIRGLLHVQNSEFDTEQVLSHLEATYDKICDTHDYSKDLPTYLRYCKDIVFEGLAPSFEYHEEENMIKQLWNFYENEEEAEPLKKAGIGGSSRCSQVHFNSMQMDDVKPNVGCSSNVHKRDRTSYVDSHLTQIFDKDHRQEKKNPLPNDHALKQLKSNMEENGFCYIPPRVNLKRFDYLHYVRKNDDGTLSYVAHADYYILLRVCARLVQVDARYMHVGMLRLEKRLAWIEKRIDYCLHLSPPNLCPKSDANAEPPIDMNDSNVEETCMD